MSSLCSNQSTPSSSLIVDSENLKNLPSDLSISKRLEIVAGGKDLESSLTGLIAWAELNSEKDDIHALFTSKTLNLLLQNIANYSIQVHATEDIPSSCILVKKGEDENTGIAKNKEEINVNLIWQEKEKTHFLLFQRFLNAILRFDGQSSSLRAKDSALQIQGLTEMINQKLQVMIIILCKMSHIKSQIPIQRVVENVTERLARIIRDYGEHLVNCLRMNKHEQNDTHGWFQLEQKYEENKKKVQKLQEKTKTMSKTPRLLFQQRDLMYESVSLLHKQSNCLQELLCPFESEEEEPTSNNKKETSFSSVVSPKGKKGNIGKNISIDWTEFISSEEKQVAMETDFKKIEEHRQTDLQTRAEHLSPFYEEYSTIEGNIHKLRKEKDALLDRLKAVEESINEENKKWDKVKVDISNKEKEVEKNMSQVDLEHQTILNLHEKMELSKVIVKEFVGLQKELEFKNKDIITNFANVALLSRTNEHNTISDFQEESSNKSACRDFWKILSSEFMENMANYIVYEIQCIQFLENRIAKAQQEEQKLQKEIVQYLPLGLQSTVQELEKKIGEIREGVAHDQACSKTLKTKGREMYNVARNLHSKTLTKEGEEAYAKVQEWYRRLDSGIVAPKEAKKPIRVEEREITKSKNETAKSESQNVPVESSKASNMKANVNQDLNTTSAKRNPWSNRFKWASGTTTAASTINEQKMKVKNIYEIQAEELALSKQKSKKSSSKNNERKDKINTLTESQSESAVPNNDAARLPPGYTVNDVTSHIREQKKDGVNSKEDNRERQPKHSNKRNYAKSEIESPTACDRSMPDVSECKENMKTTDKVPDDRGTLHPNRSTELRAKGLESLEEDKKSNGIIDKGMLGVTEETEEPIPEEPDKITVSSDCSNERLTTADVHASEIEESIEDTT